MKKTFNLFSFFVAIFLVTTFLQSGAFARDPGGGGNLGKTMSSSYFQNPTLDGTSTAKVFNIEVYTGNVKFTNPYTNQEMTTSAGTFKGEVNGVTAYFYCIDISHYIAFYKTDQPHTYTDSGFTPSAITYILNNYYPFRSYPYTGSASTVQIEAAAIQLAIWHFADGVNINSLTGPTGSLTELKNRANAIINDALANAGNVIPVQTLTIIPDFQIKNIGQAGTFVAQALDVNGNGVANLNIGFSTTSGTLSSTTAVTNSTGVTPNITITQGSNNIANISASTTVTIPQGTRYVHTVEPGTYQKLVLATPTTTTRTAQGIVKWYQPQGDCDLNGYVTYTQGGWGSPSNSTPGNYRDTYFSTLFPTGLVLGSTYNMTFQNAAAIKNYLPAGGTAAALTQNYTNPTTTTSGVFGGQLTALALNLAFDDANVLGLSSVPLGSLEIISGPLAGKTVYQVFALAKLALGGQTTAYTIADLNTALTAINENFDNGTTNNGYLRCPLQKASIGDKVWFDTNKNGIQDNGETGVPGISVKLFDCSNNLIATTTTDANGNYLFANLTPGHYYVQFILPSGYAFSPKDQGSNDAVDSDADLLTGKTICTTLSPSENDMTWDAGIYICMNTLGDFVWRDKNANGIQDAGEPGIQGVVVELLNSNNSVIATSTTNASGLYQFTNIPNGIYIVRLAASNFASGGVLYSTVKEKWYASPKDQGSDDTKDSDGDETLHTASVTLTCGDNPTIDFGFYKSCVSFIKTGPTSVLVGDTVIFHFRIENCGDLVLGGGVDVIDSLLKPTGDHIIANATVNPGAVWEFDKPFVTTANHCGNLLNVASAVGHPKLPNGTYLANVVDNSQWTVTVICNNSSLGDRVWEDLNKNGKQDAGEPGVGNVTVKLYDCNNVLKGTTTTNASGYYLFANLFPGNYYVQFVLPTGYVFTSKDQGSNDSLDSDADVTTGKTICTTITAGENDMTWDAGIYKPVYCVTNWTGSLGPDSAICLYEPQWITIKAEVHLTPNPSKARVQTSWRIVHPHELDTSYNYNSFWIYQDTTFYFSAYWPGITSTDSIVEIHYGLNVLDCDGNPIHNGIGRDLYWYPWVCPPPAPNHADISVIKSASKTNPQDNENISYTILVKNNGPKNATGVVVLDVLPAGVKYLSYTATQGTYDTATGKWTVGNLNNGATATLTINVKVQVGGASTAAIDLGAATGYNVFVFYDINQPSSDTQGKLAVGRNAYLSNYSVGDQLPPNSGDVLIVGNNLTYTSGAVYNGNVVYGNSTNLPIPQVSINNGTLRQESVIDFTAAELYLTNLSATLAAYPVNGTTAFEWGGLTLTGTNPFLNVFSVSGANLSSANNVSINVPSGSVVLVNISGTTVSWTGGLTVNGTIINNVLYNFYNATNITLQGIDVRGSILAPKASVNFVSGVQNGQMIAKFVSGMGQFNYELFIGNIPVDTTIINIARVIASSPTDPNPANNQSVVSVYVGGTGNGGGTGNTGNWHYVGNFGLNEIVWTLTNDLQGNILCGTMGGKIFRSVDGGMTWTRINTYMYAGFIWSLKVSSTGTIFAGTEQGLYKSTDNGTTWILTSLVGKDVRSITIDATGKLYAATWGFGIYKSIDNGLTWTQINNGLNSFAINSIVINPSQHLFIGGIGSGVSKSTDYGMTWNCTNIGYNYVWSLAVTTNGVLYAGTYGSGVYRSIDNGASWSQVNNGLLGQFIYSIIVDAGNNVYVSSWENGVFVSSNGGDSWMNSGMSGRGVSSLLLNPASNVLFAGTSDGKIYSNNNPFTDVKMTKEIPATFKLEQNYPNPFNPSTKIEFSVAKREMVSVKIYNIIGQVVKTLINQELEAGKYSVTFDANELASGIYIYRLTSNSANITRKMILQK